MDQQALATATFRRILLIKLSAVGDVVHTFPVLNQLRRRYPAAQIDWLVKPQIADLVRHHPAVNNVILFHDREWRSVRTMARGVTLGMQLLRQLRSTRYDLVIDMHGQVRTAIAAAATGAAVRIGFDRPRKSVRAVTDRKLPPNVYDHAWIGAREGSWLAYTHRIPIDTLEMHAVDRYLRVGTLLGFADSKVDFSFAVPAEASAQVDLLLAQNGIASRGPASRFALMSPGTVWETKQWPAEKFAAVAQAFIDGGLPVVLAGSPADDAACGAVAARAPEAKNLCGRTSLAELAALIGRCEVAITNDSGPMHMAVALGRPTVTVFGPTDALWIGPYRRNDSVATANVACAPCYLRQLKHCSHGHRCMQSVAAETVTTLARRLMANEAPFAPTSAGAAVREHSRPAVGAT